MEQVILTEGCPWGPHILPTVLLHVVPVLLLHPNQDRSCDRLGDVLHSPDSTVLFYFSPFSSNSELLGWDTPLLVTLSAHRAAGTVLLYVPV